MVIRALRDAANSGDPTQWFRAQLPALEPDREAEYRVEWLRAGQRIATLPADGSWYRLRGVGDPSPAVTPSQSKWPSQPRFGYDLDFFAAVTVNLSAQPIGPTPEGYRVNFAITDGRMVGPGIDAVVEPNSGDWMCVRPDGIGVVDIKITLRDRRWGDHLRAGGRRVRHRSRRLRANGGGHTERRAPALRHADLVDGAPGVDVAQPAAGRRLRSGGMADLQVQCDVYLPTVQV